MGTRNSVQREWIYDYIQRQDAHLSADEIYEGLLKEGKNISFDNCRFEIPPVAPAGSNAYVNSCMMNIKLPLS